MNGSNSGLILKCALINSSFKNIYTIYQNVIFKECVKQNSTESGLYTLIILKMDILEIGGLHVLLLFEKNPCLNVMFVKRIGF